MHMDDNKLNNARGNLRWGTHRQNAVDMAMKSRGGGQKVNVEQARAIVERRTLGESGAKLAREFNISPQRVCDIFKGRTSIL